MGRGITMDEWVHFKRLPEEGRVPNSSYWYVHCQHCVRGFEQKQLFNPPQKLTGRRSAMKAHLKICPMYATQYKMEQRALQAAAAAAAATAAVAESVVASDATAIPTTATVAVPSSTLATDVAMVGTVTIKTQSGEKRKRRGEDVEASGPRGGRGKHCMMEEWEHFIRLQDEGYIGKSNFFYAVCRHCQAAHDEASDDKKPMLVPEKLVGRREKMRKHLSVCPFFHGDLPSMERRASQARIAGFGAFLPMPTSDGIKMVPASALTSAAGLEAAGIENADGTASSLPTAAGAAASTRLALDEWQFFTRLHRKKDSAYYFARCNFCQQAFDNAPETLKASMTPTIVMGRKSNMQTHLSKCPYVPKDAVLYSRMLASRDDLPVATKRLKVTGNGDLPSLHQAVVEVLIQHQLPFEWVDSSSAKKLLRMAAAGVNWHASMLPNSAELRSHVLDDLVRDEFQPDIDKIKQSVAMPSPVPATSTATEPLPDDPTSGPSDASLVPVVMAVAFRNAEKSQPVPTIECAIRGNGVNVQLQYIAQEKIGSDDGTVEDDAMLATAPSSTISNRLLYNHGLDVARVLFRHVRLLEEDQQLTPCVLTTPPSVVITRAIGALRSRRSNITVVWDVDDIVSYCVRQALMSPQIRHVVDATVQLLRQPAVQAAIAPNAGQHHLDDWKSFAALGRALLSEELSNVVEMTVNKADLVRVLALFRAFASFAKSSADDGRGALADTLSHFATMYSAAEGFTDIQRALEVTWYACEQPLFLLAHALHPHLRLRGLASTELTKLSVLSDLTVGYFGHFFPASKPQSLRGDVTSYLHASQAVFAEAFISEFPVVDDYYRYLRDNFIELAALMQLLHTIPVYGSGPNVKPNTSVLTPGASADEQSKLALLAERWGLETVNGALVGSDESVAKNTSAAESTSDVVEAWLKTLTTKLKDRTVDYSSWEVEFAADETAPPSTSVAVVLDDIRTASSTDEDLPIRAEDDEAAFPSVPLPSWRAKKVRLAQLFGANETTTV